jgi:hypothetical protein
LRIGEGGDYDVFVGPYSPEHVRIKRWLRARIGPEPVAFEVHRHGQDEAGHQQIIWNATNCVGLIPGSRFPVKLGGVMTKEGQRDEDDNDHSGALRRSLDSIIGRGAIVRQ